jgi:hypothetical protein
MTPSASREGSALMSRLAIRISQIPRLVRLVLVLLFAAALTLLFSPLIDALYLRYFFPWNEQIVTDVVRLLPSIVSAAAGCIMFAIGWVIMVGSPGKSLPRSSRLVVYFAAGIALLVVAMVQIISGLIQLANAI